MFCYFDSKNDVLLNFFDQKFRFNIISAIIHAEHRIPIFQELPKNLVVRDFQNTFSV